MVCELVLAVAVLTHLFTGSFFVSNQLPEHLGVKRDAQVLFHFDNFLQTN